MLRSINNIPLDSYKWDILTYEDPSSDIRIQHPFDWKIQPYNLNARHVRDDVGDKIVELSPLLNATDASGFSWARVTIASAEVKSNINIDQVATNLVKTYREQNANFKLLEMDNNTSLSGLPAFKLVFTLTPEDVPFRGMIIGTVLDSTLYRIIYVSPSYKFDTYLPKVTHMLESFKIGLE